MADDDPEVWDFALPDQPKRFKFNGPDVYEAPPILPIPALRRMAGMQSEIQGLSASDKFDKLIVMFDAILMPESAKRFKTRMESYDHPIDLTRQLLPLLNKLMESYGLRPTEPSSSSTDGGVVTGVHSTAGAPARASTQKSSRRTAGSTSSTTTS